VLTGVDLPDMDGKSVGEIEKFWCDVLVSIFYLKINLFFLQW